MKILFMGTPDFAVPSLEVLINSGHEVSCVFTQTDKPVGRKQILTFSKVKECAIKNGIEVYQPKTLRTEESINKVKEISPDVIVVVAYGKILPKEILDYPKYGCINIHGSLLPKYRGAAPIQWSVINGEKEAGVTSMFMDVGLDTGDMLIKKSTEILPNETSGELYDRLKVIGAKVLIETLNNLQENKIQRIKQDDSQMTLAPMLSKELSSIDFNKSAKEIHNLIRGLNPWPIAKTILKGKGLKIYKSEVSNEKGSTPGEIVSIIPLVVSCGNGQSIELKEVQLEGKKRMAAKDFVPGAHIKVGDTLG